MAAQMQPFLRSPAFQQGELATVAFDGGDRRSADTTRELGTQVSGRASNDELVEPQDGYFAGQVTANRTAAVVLKATFDPGVARDRRWAGGTAVHGRSRFRRRDGRARHATR